MIKDKNVLIFGLGKEGTAAANFLGKLNNISVVDKKPKEKLGEFLEKIKVPISFYQENKIPKSKSFDLIIRSPGIRPDKKLIAEKIAKGAQLTSVTKLFFDLCSAKIIAITGTKGKGTTATLIYEIIKSVKSDVYLAGNIGTPAFEVLPKLKKESFVVLELSSFQLMDLTKSPHIAVVLMITSEHLDWHMTHDEYLEAKETIVKFQTKNDFAVINRDFKNSKNFAAKTKANVFFISTKVETNGVYALGDKIFSRIDGFEVLFDTRDVLLPGKHNLQNVTAAAAVAKILHIKNQNIQKVIKSFKGLHHRLQLIRELKGIRFYNDSFSTTPETTIAAIEAFSAPKILIVGGSSKKSDFSRLGQIIAKSTSIKALVPIGVEGPRILKAVSAAGGFTAKIIEGAKNMKTIVEKSYKIAQKGDVVILSPACASFDMFKNYQDRGEQFIKFVRELK